MIHSRLSNRSVAAIALLASLVFPSCADERRAPVTPNPKFRYAASEGRWSVTYNSGQYIYQGSVKRLYRICDNGPGTVRVLADNNFAAGLARGDCADVEGQSLRI